MSEEVFTVAEKRPAHPGMTISRSAGLGSGKVTWFSMAAGTSISRESYDSTAIYLGGAGCGELIIGSDARAEKLLPGGIIVVPGGTLCGLECSSDFIYTEIITEKEITMTDMLKPGEAASLKDLISYEEGSIANLDVAHNDKMKFVLMAFDEGTGLSPHRAPGDAIVTALEGKAVIGYEGKDYHVEAGQSFRFAKNGLHSVTADGKFKMSLLLVLE